MMPTVEKTFLQKVLHGLKNNDYHARAFLTEVPAFFLIMAALERYLNTIGMSMTELSPHPYIIGVLAFGMVYGLVLGSAVGALAALLSVSWTGVEHLHAMEVVTELFGPFSLLISGVLVGAVSEYRKASLQEVRQTSYEMVEKISELEKDREELTQTNLVLEQKVVSREDTVVTLYEASQKLGSLSVEEIYESIPGLLSSYLKASSCSVYLQQGQQLVCIVTHGWKHENSHPTKYDQDHPLYRIVQQSPKVLSVSELEGVDSALMVAPLVTKDQYVHGILKIEQMDFLELTAASVTLMNMLQVWIIQAIENARSYGLSQQTQMRDPGTGAYSWFYFKERLIKEVHLAQRYGLNFSTTFFQIKDFQQMSADMQKRVLGIVYRVMEFQFRDDDLIAVPESNQTAFQFVVIHPFTDRKGSCVAVERCVQEVAGYDLKPLGNEQTLEVIPQVVELDDQTLLEHTSLLPILKVSNVKATKKVAV